MGAICKRDLIWKYYKTSPVQVKENRRKHEKSERCKTYLKYQWETWSKMTCFLDDLNLLYFS